MALNTAEKQCIIEFQAFRGNKDEFIVKELVIFDMSTHLPYYFLFKCPYPYSLCNTKSSKCNNWLTKHCHKLDWNEGYVEYEELDKIMFHFCKQFNSIFTTGSEKAKWISRYTSFNVFDVKLNKLNKDLKFQPPLCIAARNNDHAHQNCSLSKVYKMTFQFPSYTFYKKKATGPINGGTADNAIRPAQTVTEETTSINIHYGKPTTSTNFG